MIKRTKQNGFSLIEASISLVIIGLVITGGIAMFRPLVKKAESMKTSTNALAIEQALYSFVLQNDRLPCPALNNFASNTENVGVENCSIPSTNGVNFGLIPWRSLGLNKEKTMDGYNGFFSYAVDSNYNKNNSLKCTQNLSWKSLTASIIIEDGTKTTPPAFARSAFALISHGENSYGATLNSGKTKPYEAATSDEQSNTNQNQSPKFFSVGINGNVLGFDDKIYSKTPAQIMVETGCAKR